MSLLPTTPLLRIAQAHPAAARALRRLGLDEPSLPDLTLAQACEAAGLSVLDTMRFLESVVPDWAPKSPKEWAETPLPEFVEYLLQRHHGYARTEIDRLELLLNHCLARYGSSHPEFEKVRAHFQHFKEDLLSHLGLEEQQIFPAILQGTATPHGNWESQLHAEHTAVEELFQNIGALLSHYDLPEGTDVSVKSLLLGLRDLEEDLHMHIFLENEVLFPRSAERAQSVTSDPVS